MRESFISKNWIMLLISEANKSEIIRQPGRVKTSWARDDMKP